MGKGATSGSAPSNWPASLPYLFQPWHSPHLTNPQREALKLRGSIVPDEIPASCGRGASANARIVAINDPAHPASGQSGLFASRALEPGSFIVPYYGIVHSGHAPHNAAHEKSDYDLWLDRIAGIAVDAAEAGNEARFVNDYRGVKERPNAEFKEAWDARSGERCMAVFVLAAGKGGKKGGGGIKKGEEILVSYGRGFWDNRKNVAGDDAGSA